MKTLIVVIFLIFAQSAFATNEAIYKTSIPNTIRLSFNSTPIETKSGYMRLAGIISTSTRSALIELNGKGSIVGNGDKLSDYMINIISENGVIICLKN